jgi:hypothetical protein
MCFDQLFCFLKPFLFRDPVIGRYCGHLLDPLEQLTRGKLKRMSYTDDVLKTDIPFSTLHSTDIGTMEIGSLSQFFLRETKFQPAITDRGSEFCL